MRGKVTLIRLMLLLVGTTLLVTNCFRKPMAEPFPTPTPLPSGDIFFDSKDLAETRAIEVVIVKLTERQVPVVEHSIVITEPTSLQEIAATLLTATSAICTTALPTPQQRSGYGINLYLYSHSEVLPLSAVSSQWMLASISYSPDINYIGINRPNGRGGRIIEFCPVETSLREILERELALRGVRLEISQ